MKIYSVHSSSDLSAQTLDRIQTIVLAAKGPIVLPLDLETIHSCKKIAQQPAFVQAIRTHTYPLNFLMIAVLALAEKKIIFPFYNSDFKKIGKKFGPIERAAEKLFERTEDHKRVANFRKRGVAGMTAEQLVAIHSRWQKNPPELIIGEDNFVRVLGRLFRIKVHRLTPDEPATKRLVRRTMNEIPAQYGVKRRPRKRPHM